MMLEHVDVSTPVDLIEVHSPRVPLVAERRDGVDAPVDEDAELGVLVPVRDIVPGQRVPVGRERAGEDRFVDRCKVGVNRSGENDLARGRSFCCKLRSAANGDNEGKNAGKNGQTYSKHVPPI